ncbi:DUF805 domain-containing protein [Microbacterium binotii]|uniref:DUF805 domain-containing protein n=1 Tax=Microbacterium binotii TaxID=462710 RepID=A0ABN3PAA2_9MICO
MTSSTIALSHPLYGASWPQAIARYFLKYATFSGRASRSEFWWWVLTNALVGLGFQLVSSAVGEPLTFSAWPAPYLVWNGAQSDAGVTTAIGAIAALYSLLTLLPGLALTWRRLHDVDRSGLWFFIVLIPLIGVIVLLVFTTGRSRPAGARFDRYP